MWDHGCRAIGSVKPMRIEKKIWPQYFELVLSGVKKYEVRLADFDCRPGDELVLKEWDPVCGAYTGRQITKQVTLVSRTKDQDIWSDADVERYGFVVIGFE